MMAIAIAGVQQDRIGSSCAFPEEAQSKSLASARGDHCPRAGDPRSSDAKAYPRTPPNPRHTPAIPCAGPVGGEKPVLAQAPIRPGDQHRACSENKYRACSQRWRAGARDPVRTRLQQGERRQQVRTMFLRLRGDRCPARCLEIERRRVATGANHPASHSSALRRGPGTPARCPSGGPEHRNHVTPNSPLVRQDRITSESREGDGESCHWCPFTTVFLSTPIRCFAEARRWRPECRDLRGRRYRFPRRFPARCCGGRRVPRGQVRLVGLEAAWGPSGSRPPLANTTAKYGMAIAPTRGIAVSQPRWLTNSTTAIMKQAARMPIMIR